MDLRLICTCWFLVLFGCVYCPPVNPKDDVDSATHDSNRDPLNHVNELEYKKYIQEVVNILETDPVFREKLQSSALNSSETGAIAMYLEFANRHTRTKLDELKRMEVRRLHELHVMQMKDQADSIRKGKRDVLGKTKVDMGHLDNSNPHTFEVEDLSKLIKKTTDDLHKLDAQRREEFKRYEMQKEHEFKDQLSHMNETARHEAEKQHEESEKRHAEHPKVNHPGNKEQLQEVWEEVDHMDKADFQPATLFSLHDLDGDGFLNIEELEALFQKELDKLYSPGNPDDDQVERNEEMNRMREHVVNEIDTDKDGMVSLQEFLRSTETNEYQKEDSWKTLEDEPTPFTDDEFKQFEEAIKEGEKNLKESHHDSEQPTFHENELNQVVKQEGFHEFIQDKKLEEAPPKPQPEQQHNQ